MDSATIAALVMGLVIGPIMLFVGVALRAKTTDSETRAGGHVAGAVFTRLGALCALVAGVAMLVLGVLTAFGVWSGNAGTSAIVAVLLVSVVAVAGFVVAGAVLSKRAANEITAPEQESVAR